MTQLPISARGIVDRRVRPLPPHLTPEHLRKAALHHHRAHLDLRPLNARTLLHMGALIPVERHQTIRRHARVVHRVQCVRGQIQHDLFPVEAGARQLGARPRAARLRSVVGCCLVRRFGDRWQRAASLLVDL